MPDAPGRDVHVEQRVGSGLASLAHFALARAAAGAERAPAPIGTKLESVACKEGLPSAPATALDQRRYSRHLRACGTDSSPGIPGSRQRLDQLGAALYLGENIPPRAGMVNLAPMHSEEWCTIDRRFECDYGSRFLLLMLAGWRIAHQRLWTKDNDQARGAGSAPAGPISVWSCCACFNISLGGTPSFKNPPY